MFNWFKKKDNVYEGLPPHKKALHDEISEYATSLGIYDSIPLNQACWIMLIEIKKLNDELQRLKQ